MKRFVKRLRLAQRTRFVGQIDSFIQLVQWQSGVDKFEIDNVFERLGAVQQPIAVC